MQIKERRAQEQRDAALVNRLVPPTPPPARDSEPLLPEATPQDHTWDDDPDEIFRSAVSEIETQPLLPQPPETPWSLVIVMLVFILSYVGGTVIALITYPTVTIDVVSVTKSVSVTMPLAFTLRPGEVVQPLDCTFNVTPIQHVGQEAATVTVRATATCKGMAYDREQLNQQATRAFTTQASPGAPYRLVGEVQVQVVSATPLIVSCRGLWAYTLSQDYELFLAERIAGDSPQQARKYLLHTGFLTSATVPDKLPLDPAHIQFQVFIGL